MLSSIIQVTGVAVIIIGVGFFSIPAAVIVAGIALVLIGLAVSK